MIVINNKQKLNSKYHSWHVSRPTFRKYRDININQYKVLFIKWF